MKTIAFSVPKKPSTAEEWVKGAPEKATPAEPMKRFTIDVPVRLHARVKVECARRGLKMADVIRELLEREFPKA
jgi:ParG